MNISKEKAERQSKLLEDLKSRLKKADIEGMIEKVEVDGLQMEILHTAFYDPDDEPEDIMEVPTTDFFFMNTEMSADDVFYFTGVVTLTEKLYPETLYDLMKAVLAINTSMPFGHYVLNPSEGLLALRIDSRYPMKQSDESIATALDMEASHLVVLNSAFSKYVVDVAKGELTYEEFLGVTQLGELSGEEDA